MYFKFFLSSVWQNSIFFAYEGTRRKKLINLVFQVVDWVFYNNNKPNNTVFKGEYSVGLLSILIQLIFFQSNVKCFWYALSRLELHHASLLNINSLF